MIILYPMLTSSSVSPNILPAICKSVEKYLLVYGIEGIINRTQTELPDLADMIKKKIYGEGIVIEQYEEDEEEIQTPGITAKGGREQKRDEEGKRGGKKASEYTVQSPSKDVLSLEPTWIKIDTPKGTDLVGVKVLPYIVKSDQAFSQLLIDDRKTYGIKRWLNTYLRLATRLVYAILRGVRLPFIGRVGAQFQLSGDPKRDILYAKTDYLGNVFACVSYHDVSDDEYFKSPGGVSKLFEMGWGSFIVCDDVDRRATFCMKEFNGLCSTVPYQMLYTSFGKDYAKVYSDLEELKKSASPFFRMGLTRFRVG